MDLLVSREFTVPRVAVARITAEEYARQFWWFILPSPVFGFALLLLSRDPLFQFLGALGCVWPLTIPFRAYFLTARLARILSNPTIMKLTEDGVYFLNAFKSHKVPYMALRNVTERHGFLILNTKRYTTMLAPVSALEDGCLADFFRIAKDHGVPIRSRGLLGL